MFEKFECPICDNVRKKIAKATYSACQLVGTSKKTKQYQRIINLEAYVTRLEERLLILETKINKIQINKMADNQIRENLAEYAHNAWAYWMQYMFSKMKFNPSRGLIMPAWAVDRWSRQTATEYKNLSEKEKESNRQEADKMIAILGEKKCQKDSTRSE
jgi:hypothetical protein